MVTERIIETIDAALGEEVAYNLAVSGLFEFGSENTELHNDSGEVLETAALSIDGDEKASAGESRIDPAGVNLFGR